jgi:hypothetical protein
MIDRTEHTQVRIQFLPGESESSRWFSGRLEVDYRYLCASLEFQTGAEHWVALLLEEAVKCGALDVRRLRHFFELCEKGDGPRPDGRSERIGAPHTHTKEPMAAKVDAAFRSAANVCDHFAQLAKLDREKAINRNEIATYARDQSMAMACRDAILALLGEREGK